MAKILMFDEQEKGGTDQEAKDNLSREFEKNHLKWKTRFAVGVVGILQNKKKS